MAAGGDIPHDLATFLIEHELGLRHGFWGAVADGATFRSLRRRRTDRGVAIIRRHRAALDDAEAKVNEIYSAWRAHRPTPLDDVLDRTLAEWRALPEGGELERRWTAGSSGRSARRS